MAGDNFQSYLQEWVGKEITVVNPESYKLTALGRGLSFQTYKANLVEMGSDYLRLQFTSMKGDEKHSVEQIIPLDRVKRISIWGDEKLVHL